MIYYSKNNGMTSSSFSYTVNTESYKGVCDFKWTTEKDPDNTGNDDYLMAIIVIKDSYINLLGTKVTINGKLNSRFENVNKNDCGGQKNLIDNLYSSKSFAYFSDTSDYFYFYSYNDTSLKSGYY